MGRRRRALLLVLALTPGGPAAGPAAAVAPTPHHVITGTVSGHPESLDIEVAADELGGWRRYAEEVTPGRFSIRVPDGTYRVSFEDVSGWSASEVYDSKPYGEPPTPVVVDGANVSLGAVELAPLTYVHGFLSAPAHVLGGYEVQVYPADDFSDSAMRLGDDWGGFSARLEPGDYKIRFGGGDFASEWYGDANNFQDAAVVHVTGTELDLDLGLLQVSAGGTIEGTVRDPSGAPVRKALVEAVNKDGDPIGRTYSTDSGHYALSRLAAGDYRVRVGDPRPGGPISETYLPGTVALTEDATDSGHDVVVPRTSVGLPAGADLAGRVVDTTGRPVQGVQVGVVRDCEPNRFEWDSAQTTLTDSDGRWAISGLAPWQTEVVVAFSDVEYAESDGGVEGYDYVTEFSGGARTCADASPVAPPDLGVDVVLSQKGGISGSVTVDGRPAVDGWVLVYPDAERQPPQGDHEDPWVASARPCPDYSLDQLPPGPYRVLFVSGGAATWWPHATAWATAQTVTVRPGRHEAGVDGAVVGGELVNLQPPQVNGTPLVGRQLNAVRDQWRPFQRTQTYAWVREDGLPVSSASTYRPGPDDAGHTLSVTVTATSGNQVLSVASAPFGPIQALPVTPSPTPTPTPSPTPTRTPTPTPTPTPTRTPTPTPDPTGTAAPAVPGAPTVQSATTTTARVSAPSRRSRAVRLRVRVTPAVSGVVTVRRRNAEAISYPVTAGAVPVIPLPRGKPGRHRYVVMFVPTSIDLLPSRTSVMVMGRAVRPADRAAG